MKKSNLVIIYQQEAAKQFMDYYTEYLDIRKGEVSFPVWVSYLHDHLNTIKTLLSPVTDVAYKGFLQAFQDGFTHMMIDEADYIKIEGLLTSGQDFKIVVFTEEGKPIGSYDKKVVNL